ncbi:MAG: DUF4870 domain-containing protein [Leeuwenhoekiella sp.]
MENTISTAKKNVAVFIHLSTFLKYFFPLGNFIAPIILWVAQRNHSRFVDNHGRQALNFQLSVLLYTLLLLVFALPIFLWQLFHVAEVSGGFGYIENYFDTAQSVGEISGFIITAVSFGLLIAGLYIFEIILVISATVAASNGQAYRYPLSITFLKPEPDAPNDNPSASSPEAAV